jgi:hypothetical protein
MATRNSSQCAQSFVEQHAVEVLLRLIDSCNRSRPHQVIVGICLKILHNISTFKSLVPYIVHIGQEPKRIATMLHIAQTYYTLKPPKISLQALDILTLIVRRMQPAQRKILFPKIVRKSLGKTKSANLLLSVQTLQKAIQRKCKGKVSTSTLKSRNNKRRQTKADGTMVTLKRCLRLLSQVIHLSESDI